MHALICAFHFITKHYAGGILSQGMVCCTNTNTVQESTRTQVCIQVCSMHRHTMHVYLLKITENYTLHFENQAAEIPSQTGVVWHTSEHLHPLFHM